MPRGSERAAWPPRDRGPRSAALLPLSWLYAAGVAADRALRVRARPAAGPSPRIVSVGNLEAGGSGKTPLSMWILEAVAGRGGRAAYVSRGYGGRSARGPLVTRVPGALEAAAARAGERLIARDHPELAAQVGDEGAMVAGRVPAAALWFCRDKARAVRAAADAGASVIVLDDAFQSRSVPRHVDIVLLDAECPLANGRLLPAGPLREPAAALRRADAVVFNGVAGEDGLDRAAALVRPLLRPGSRVAGLVRRITLVPVRARETGPPARVLAVSAIARPWAFERALVSAGLTCAGHVIRADHHRYSPDDAGIIVRRARELAVDAVVTTEKDLVKLARLDIDCALWLARLDVGVLGDELPV